MIRTPVKSSFIKSIGYEGTTLHVELANGDVHEHRDVTPEQFASFAAAESLGRHYSQSIRGQYAHTKLGPDAKPEDASGS